MLYTILRFILLVWLLCMTLLVIRTIYQATFPASPYNRGEVVDYGAEFLQEIFAELRSYCPRFDYFVTTVNLVLSQVLLTVTMRYKVKIAMYAGASIAFAVIASAIVAGRLLFWNEPGNAFHVRSRKQDIRPAAEEHARAPEPDHTRPPPRGQGPGRGRSAPPRSAERDEELRRSARKMERDMQDLYGDADTPR
ncbi:hypothetical protein M436DRAFT_83303 [Aureobasidium namibiae CBS 147.97]|uniref:Uncharacterized protein n=1 Tax=Aureobasidium namibiae CBS 147.97 TaxID=1043004 RepID=A0A074WF33_9PEZI